MIQAFLKIFSNLTQRNLNIRASLQFGEKPWELLLTQ